MANSLEYKEPIRVICINARNSVKLIKGATYFANCLYTYSNPNDRRVTLKDVGTYTTKNFTLYDGQSLDHQPDFNVPYTRSVDTKEKNYTGHFVKCRYSSSKSMKEGEIYYVEEQVKKEMKSYGYDTKFKIRGIRNLTNPYYFEEIAINEQRNIKLKNLKGQKIKTGEQTRKFLLYSDKEKCNILLDLLAKTLIEINKVELNHGNVNLIDLMIAKGKKYDIKSEDIETFLKSKIETILKPFNL